VDTNVKSVFDLATLASAIALDLTGGGTLTNAGIATAIYNQGTAAVEKAIPIVTNSATVIPTNTSKLLTGLALVNVSSYQSLMIGQAYGNATTQATLKKCQIAWYGDAAGSFYLGLTTWYGSVQGGAVTGKVKCLGPYATFGCYGAESTTTDTTVTTTVYGSAIPLSLDRLYFANPVVEPAIVSGHNGSGGDVAWNGTYPANTTSTIDISNMQGPAIISISTGATLAHTLDLALADGNVRINSWGWAAGTPAQKGQFSIELPSAPCQLRLALGAEAASRFFFGSIVMRGRL
jgi:hypothetical protein